MRMSKELLEDLISDKFHRHIIPEILKWHREAEAESQKGYDLYTDFIENDIFLLWDADLPEADDQGAYEYEDLVTFVLRFKKIYEDFREKRDKLG